jgi:methyl-accepting chemotaxis protein
LLDRRMFRSYWKLHLVFLMVAIILGGEISLAYRTTVMHQQASEAVQRTQRILTLSNEALAALVDMETGFRGFLLTGQEQFLEPYIEGRDVYQARLAELRDQMAEEPALVGRWDDIDAEAQSWMNDITMPTIDRRRAMPVGETNLGSIVAAVSSGVGKARLDQIRRLVGEANALQQARLVDFERQQREADGRLLFVLLWGTLGAAILSLVLGGGMLLYLSRERLTGVRLAIQTAEHEMFNRLAAASGNVQMLQRDPTLSARQKRYVQRAYDSIVSTVSVVRGLRDLPQLNETVWGETVVRTITLPNQHGN